MDVSHGNSGNSRKILQHPMHLTDKSHHLSVLFTLFEDLAAGDRKPEAADKQLARISEVLLSVPPSLKRVFFPRSIHHLNGRFNSDLLIGLGLGLCVVEPWLLLLQSQCRSLAFMMSVMGRNSNLARTGNLWEKSSRRWVSRS